MSRHGITLVELMLVVVLIPIVGFTAVQLDLFAQNYFQRITRSMLAEQEVEIALGAMARDIIVARAITLYDATWTPVGVGNSGVGIDLIVDDDNDIPPDPANDDVIRYSVNASNELVREYDSNSSGVFDAGQTVSRNITTLQLTQTVEQSVPENLPTPQNVIRVSVQSVYGNRTVSRTRYVTSRALRGTP